jgi:hypothetical protein
MFTCWPIFVKKNYVRVHLPLVRNHEQAVIGTYFEGVGLLLIGIRVETNHIVVISQKYMGTKFTFP